MGQRVFARWRSRNLKKGTPVMKLYSVQEMVAGRWFTVRVYDTEQDARDYLASIRYGKGRIMCAGKKLS